MKPFRIVVLIAFVFVSIASSAVFISEKIKTDRTIPKENVFECMKKINSVTAHLPLSIGDVIIKDVFGANIVATQAKE